MNINDVIKPLRDYIEAEIIPRYEWFDKAHDLSHVEMVIENSFNIASRLEKNVGDLNPAMIYTIAAYHDTGLIFGRKNHGITSGAILLVDGKLRDWFYEAEIMTMKEAVEDHRASIEHEPRSIYGKIVGDADSLQPYTAVMQRTAQFSLQNYPDYDLETHIKRCHDHITTKYGAGGYLSFWTMKTDDVPEIIELREVATDYDKFSRLTTEYLKSEENNE